MKGTDRVRFSLAIGGAVAIVIGLWYMAHVAEEWMLAAVPPGGAPKLVVALQVRVNAPPEYDVDPRRLEEAVRDTLATRAPWVSIDPKGRDRLEVTAQIGPMRDFADGYEGWVRMSFYRSRWVPILGSRPPDWSDRVLVLGRPPRLGSPPRENVPGAARILSRNFVRMGLLRNWNLFGLLQAGADVVAAEGGRSGRGEVEDGLDLAVGAG